MQWGYDSRIHYLTGQWSVDLDLNNPYTVPAASRKYLHPQLYIGYRLFICIVRRKIQRPGRSERKKEGYRKKCAKKLPNDLLSIIYQFTKDVSKREGDVILSQYRYRHYNFTDFLVDQNDLRLFITTEWRESVVALHWAYCRWSLAQAKIIMPLTPTCPKQIFTNIPYLAIASAYSNIRIIHEYDTHRMRGDRGWVVYKKIMDLIGNDYRRAPCIE